MCASYGLDPRFDDREYHEIVDSAVLDGLRAWAVCNGDEIVRPTGRNLRNLSPLITGLAAWDEAWWGYLVDGMPARFASINTRSERLRAGRGPLPARAIVPATSWREMAKPSRTWHEFSGTDRELLGLAAVTRPGQTADGTGYLCYSIVMQPAPPQLADIHDRMPLLIAPGFVEEWVGTPNASAGLIDAAVAASDPLVDGIRVVLDSGADPADDSGRLF